VLCHESSRLATNKKRFSNALFKINAFYHQICWDHSTIALAGTVHGGSAAGETANFLLIYYCGPTE